VNPGPGSERASQAGEALRFLFCLPCIELGVGPLQVDPMDALLGRPLAELLAPVLTGPPAYAIKGGVRMKCWPCSLKEKQGIELKLSFLGELALYNDGGLFRLTVPLFAGMVLTPLLTPYLRSPPEPKLLPPLMQLSYRVDIPAGATLTIPLPTPYKLLLERV